jgi:hypothetical protein
LRCRFLLEGQPVPGLNGIHFREERRPAMRSVGKSLEPGDFEIRGIDAVVPTLTFANDEATGRAALQDYLEDHGDEGLRAATSPERPEVVPDLRIVGISSIPGLTARTVAFEQSKQSSDRNPRAAPQWANAVWSQGMMALPNRADHAKLARLTERDRVTAAPILTRITIHTE